MTTALPLETMPSPPRSPLEELLSLAAPTVAQMASYTVMQFIDTWMLSHLGTDAPTAAANSGLMAWSLLGFGFGSICIVNTLASQAYGRKDDAACGTYLWQGIWFGIAYAVLLLPAILFAGPMFRAFGHAPEQVALESTYYRIALGGAVLKLIATAIGQFMLAIDRPGSVLLAAASGVAVNVLAAWMFIFGHFGFSPMGVAGSAWATNVGTAVEMGVLILAMCRPAIARRFHVGNWKPRRDEMRSLLRYGLPAGAQWLTDILAWSIFCNVVIGAVSLEAMAANTFTMRYMVVSFMPAIGVSTAVTALVGRYIGAGRPDIAIQRTHLAFFVTATWQISCGLGFFLGRYSLLRVFTDSPEVLKVGVVYLTFSAVYQLFDSLYIIYNGALRGAGDTFVPATVTAILNWTISVGGGYVVARYLPILGPGGPWLLATTYGAILGLFILARFRRGKWKQIRIGGDATPNDPMSNVATASATLS